MWVTPRRVSISCIREFSTLITEPNLGIGRGCAMLGAELLPFRREMVRGQPAITALGFIPF